MNNQKIYIIVILVLLLVVAFLIYNQFFKTDRINNTPQGAPGEELVIGNQKAPVTIIEYYSYLCGYCKIFENQTMPKLMKNYITTGKAKLILRPFPPYELVEAVFCANDQGKFSEYHNYLFANNDQINSIDILKAFANNLGLNKDEFGDCIDSRKYKSRAEGTYNQGNNDFKKANIPTDKQGTPTFFINGEAIIGAVPYDDFVELIEKKLAN